MRHNRRLRWAAIPIAAVLSLVLAGCTQAQLNGFLPGFVEGEPPVTNHTERIIRPLGDVVDRAARRRHHHLGPHIWAVIAYRRRKGQTGLPVQLRYNMPIEIFYTIVPLILVLGFFAFTARDQAAIEQRFAADDPDVQIEVIGKRWAWDFNYVNEDVYSPGIQGQARRRGPEGSLVRVRAAHARTCPVGKNVEIELESRDVIHSFWVVDFLYKKDMIPGQDQLHVLHPRARGHLPGQVRRAVRRVPLAACSSTSRSSRRPSTTTTSSHSRDAGQRGPARRASTTRNQNLPGTGEPELQEEQEAE